MSSSEEPLREHLRALARARGIVIDEQWLPAVELHLRRLLEAAQVVDASEPPVQPLAPKLEP
jgi:hypothetical protein